MTEGIVKLWNENTKESIIKRISEDEFKRKFLNSPYFDKEGTIILFKDKEVIGFGNAVITNENEVTPGFITCIIVSKKHQRKGLGTRILEMLENYLKSNNKKRVRQLFLNPINVEWIIPGSHDHNHPGLPAVPFNTPWYFLLMSNGYNVEGQQQDAYYKDIKNFKLPDKILKRNEENSKEGYNISFYNKEKHEGFEELFKALENPQWGKVVSNNIKKTDPNPMLIVEKEGRILGWTGPLYTEPSGRGYFAGIGVHPEAQGKGLGTSLFFELVLQSKNNGATFMSLFTGSSNPARNMYLNAGFKIVQSFAILTKNLT